MLTRSVETAHDLGERGDVAVRCALSWNTFLPAQLRLKLAKDVAEVRSAVAESFATPVELLRVLTRDADHKVSSRALGHRLVESERDRLRAELMSTSVGVLADLAESEDREVRIAVARNPATSEGTRTRLAHLDQDREVRMAASEPPEG